MPIADPTYLADESFAVSLDEADPLAQFRDRFHLPRHTDGEPAIYFCSNSLGLQPKQTRRFVQEELDHWAILGVEGHFHGSTPWYTYQELLREPAARLVGALPREVIHMNGLTVNLHLMLATFFQPTADRFQILMEEPAFPSDLYAVKTHLRHRGFDPSQALVTVRPRDGEDVLRSEDIESTLEQAGSRSALVLFNAVNFLTGQWLDVERITDRAQKHGCIVGWDLAHAAGNVPLSLHNWNVDFAVWCTYKYLNAGPGAIAGCFVHEKHGCNPNLPRLGGWWGNDPQKRFQMQLQPEFIPHVGADGWQVSNPPILALAPLRASLALYDEAGMATLRAKSEALTGYLHFLLERIRNRQFDIITPFERTQRGCQLSVRVHDKPREFFDALLKHGVICDFRQPDIIRLAPVPLYNTFHEVWRCARIVESLR